MGNPTPRYPALTGDVFEGAIIAGRYRVEGVLGRGGMGLVLAARHLHLDERVAVKLLLPGSPLTPAAFARFVREGRAAARMRSEHVARVHDAGVLETGEPYLVLEYLEGVDLRALLRKRGPLPVATAVAYVLQVCEALAEAHALGIVHRDLKPANLFLSRRPDGSDVVKVIDFGVSKMASTEPEEGSEGALTSQNAAIGTPHFMAPEQMRSARGVDGRADIWSLGAVLYGLLTGSSPFAGDTMIEVYDRILRGAPALRGARAEVSAELEAVVSRCLRVDPAERYQNVGELAAALAEEVAPEGRLSAERAIRIAGGAEPAFRVADVAEDEASGSHDTALPPGRAGSEEREERESGKEEKEERESGGPSTHGALEPSWAAPRAAGGMARAAASDAAPRSEAHAGRSESHAPGMEARALSGGSGLDAPPLLADEVSVPATTSLRRATGTLARPLFTVRRTGILAGALAALLGVSAVALWRRPAERSPEPLPVPVASLSGEARDVRPSLPVAEPTTAVVAAMPPSVATAVGVAAVAAVAVPAVTASPAATTASAAATPVSTVSAKVRPPRGDGSSRAVSAATVLPTSAPQSSSVRNVPGLSKTPD